MIVEGKLSKLFCAVGLLCTTTVHGHNHKNTHIRCYHTWSGAFVVFTIT